MDRRDVVALGLRVFGSLCQLAVYAHATWGRVVKRPLRSAFCRKPIHQPNRVRQEVLEEATLGRRVGLVGNMVIELPAFYRSHHEFPRPTSMMIK